MTDLVEPAEPGDPIDSLREELLVKGVPPDAADVLAEWAFEDADLRWWPSGAELNRLPEQIRLDDWVDHAGAAYRNADSPSHAPWELLKRLVLQGVVLDRAGDVVRRERPRGCESEAMVLRAVSPRLVQFGLDLRRAAADRELDARLLSVLLYEPEFADLLLPGLFIDMEALRSWDPTAQRDGRDLRETDRASYWIVARGERGLGQLLDIVRAEPLATAGRVAGAIMQAVLRPIDDGESAAVITRAATREVLSRWVTELTELVDRTNADDVFLLAALFDAATLLEQVTGSGDEPQPMSDVGRAANRALGRLRRSAREGAVPTDPAAAHGAEMAYRSALTAVARADGVGEMLVAGVQLLRALEEAAVPADLRWWPEPPLEPPSQVWGWLPMAMSALVHSRGRVEESDDPLLLGARTVLSRHLISRLKPQRKGSRKGQPTEPSAFWRKCCIRAAEELAADPDGRGCRVLFHVQSEDPDEGVQGLAHTAYHRLRRSPPENDSTSPRRRLIAALWWLRQAHRLELGLEVDPTGARRTRQREIAMATNPRFGDG